MNDLFNSINNRINDSLYKIDHSLHSKIKNSFIDNFIHELQAYLVKSDLTYRLSKLPKDTLFEINEIENKYVQCYLNHELFDFPKEMICTSELENADDGWSKLQLQSDGLYHVIKTKKEST